ncbi:ABC transporter substrate-binding protein [Citricoccus sp. K5]|uniref:ABC transporter substrate-binding protein n=1 Tax=Citricoccus sp. K5 TaxID=2653135 RepID=UPI0012F1AEB5|nr:ABC transporter substrate-binding protein [Citricoccus sp. K5]VXB82683.1 NitT/TauT family transport system substrate-binding protein [Citricoccus sp. K5]
MRTTARTWTSTRRRSRWLAPLLAAPLLLTACGDGGISNQESGAGTGSPAEGTATGTGGAEGTTEVRVADTAGMPSAFLQYGVNEGYFEAEGLDVTVDVSIGGAAAVPAVVNGETQFAGSNTVSAILAASKGLPITIVAAGTRTMEDPEDDFARIMASTSSGVEEVEDLEGATIAVNTLENINDVVIMTLMEDAGADRTQVKFAEMGFSDMLPALANGQVDAALLIEPFVTMAVDQGATEVASPYAESRPNMMVGTYMTSEEYAAENPETVEAFQRGISATGQAIAEDPAAFREALPEVTTIEPDLAGQIHLPAWDASVDLETLQFLNERMVRYGLIDEEISVEDIVTAPTD